MSDDRKGIPRDRLSLKEGMRLINVKFCRGHNDQITAEEFRDQLKGIEDRRASGKLAPTGAPKCRKAPVDLRALVAAI